MKIPIILLSIILVSIAILPVLSQEVFAVGSYSIQTDKSEYYQGETIIITGTVGVEPSPATYQILTFTPNSSTGLVALLTVDNNLNFKQEWPVDFFIGKSFNPYGTWTLQLLDYTNNIASKTTFTIIQEGDKPPQTAPKIIPTTPSSHTIDDKNKKKGGSCSGDCTPPTLNYNGQGDQFVTNGITINNFSTDADYFHTELKQNTTLGFVNNITLKYYENGGPSNIELIQIGFVKEIGTPLSKSEALIEVWMDYFANDIENPKIKKIVIIDPKNIIDIQSITQSLQDCNDMDDIEDLKCLSTSFQYRYKKVPESFVIVAEAFDYNKNTQRNYFNDGLIVIDPNPTEPLIVEKYEYECLDKPQKVITRNHCLFGEMKEYEAQRALESLK